MTARTPKKARPRHIVRKEYDTVRKIVSEMTASITDRFDAIDFSILDMRKQLDALSVNVKTVANATTDNSDTTPEQVEDYLNKLGRMIASDKYAGALGFLQRTFHWVEGAQHITKKQIRAIDHIAERGAPARAYDGGGSFDFDFDHDPWGSD